MDVLLCSLFGIRRILPAFLNYTQRRWLLQKGIVCFAQKRQHTAMQVIKFIFTSLIVTFIAGLILAIMFLSGFDLGLGTLLEPKAVQPAARIEQPASPAPSVVQQALLPPVQQQLQQQPSASLQKSVQQSRSTASSSSQKSTRRTSS